MTLRKLLFSFKGRIGRAEYWKGYVLTLPSFFVPIIIFAIFGAADIIIATSESDTPPEWATALDGDVIKAIATLILIPFIIFFNWACFAIATKRLHDLGLHGIFSLYWLFFNLTMFLFPLAIIGFIVLGSLKGKNEANKYGDNPLAKTV